MYIEYTRKDFSALKRQHNIMFFIGNGFDIKILKRYGSNGIISSYTKFYDFLKYKRGDMKQNSLFQKMTEDRKQDLPNWSDFENSLNELIPNTHITLKDLEKDLFELQTCFSMFLDELVTPKLLKTIGEKASQNKWATHALSSFLGDLNFQSYEKIQFPLTTGHYDLFNFLFINFNYTSLFDNYIYLDKNQFDPHKHKTIDTHFEFYPNPNGIPGFAIDKQTVWSSYIMTQIIHPHGMQEIPRSMLFGIDLEKYNPNNNIKNFIKPYWAQSDLKYKRYFEDTDLFIIYGSSIGVTDRWWWKNILETLKRNQKCELIIYYYCDETLNSDIVTQNFINACQCSDIESNILCRIRKQIFVVPFDDNSKLNIFCIED